MTNEEARLTLMLEYCPQRCDESKPCRKEDCELYNAIKALEKQIPKKLVQSKGLYKTLRGNLYPLVCPTCGCGFTRDADYPCCPKCGQALEWS